MTIFNNYARYYNILYRDKNYFQEVEFIHRLIQTHKPQAENAESINILELGCGTGKHATLLANKGYKIHGVDFSQQMLTMAENSLATLTPELKSRLQFTQGDIRTLRVNQTFDVILSLFHVISYQTTNEDLLLSFATVKEHLKPGGIFIFDIWYGPAVLYQQPEVKVKCLEDEEIVVTRIAKPTIYPNENCVDVNYEISIQDKKTNIVEDLKETHKMRYLFKPELNLLLNNFGFEIIDLGEWLTALTPGFNTWGVYLVAKV
jgi:SAM-dependent methyltransferase